jgi:hypothetical protein
MMEYQEIGDVRLDKYTQEAVVTSMGASQDTLDYACGRLSDKDFDWPVAHVVAAVLHRHYAAYKQLPSMLVLSQGVKARMSTSAGMDYIDVPDDEKPRVVSLLKTIDRARRNGTDVAWSKDRIGQYLKQLRLHRFSHKLGAAVNTGVGVDAVISDAAALARDSREDDDDEPVMEEMFDVTALASKSKDLKHIATGIADLDAALSGGPMPGELGLIIACQGVGKTNVMLNAAVSSVTRGEYNLIISAEMPRAQLIKRVFAMSACVPGSLFRTTGFDEMEPKYRERIKLVQSSFAGGAALY